MPEGEISWGESDLGWLPTFAAVKDSCSGMQAQAVRRRGVRGRRHLLGLVLRLVGRPRTSQEAATFAVTNCAWRGIAPRSKSAQTLTQQDADHTETGKYFV
eukprot:3533817-Pleurochrysis_carterae.AAC.4